MRQVAKTETWPVARSDPSWVSQHQAEIHSRMSWGGIYKSAPLVVLWILDSLSASRHYKALHGGSRDHFEKEPEMQRFRRLPGLSCCTNRFLFSFSRKENLFAFYLFLFSGKYFSSRVIIWAIFCPFSASPVVTIRMQITCKNISLKLYAEINRRKGKKEEWICSRQERERF